MTKIYDLLAKKNGMAISHFRYGYEEIPTALLTFYDMSDLNSPKFDFRTAKIKKVKDSNTMFSDSRKLTWYEDSIKEASFVAAETVAAATLTFDVSIDTIVVGDQIRNTTTGETMLVTAVTGSEITVDVNAKGVTDGDNFTRIGFGKKYGESHSRSTELNDLQTMENYIQFTAENIPSDKTDVLTNNLNRLLYSSENEYLEELFAAASRSILRNQMYSLYVGKKSATTVGGKTIYETGGIEYFLPAAYKDKNIKGGTDKATIQNIRTQLQTAYQSGVSGLYTPGRIVLFVNSAMSNALDDIFFDKITQLDNHLSSFGINVRMLDLGGYKINIIEDSILNELYDDEVAFLVDLKNIFMYHPQVDVIKEGGKSAPAFGVTKIFSPAQTTPEVREVELHTARGWVLGNITSGVFQKWIFIDE